MFANFHNLYYLKIRGCSNFKIFNLAVGANKTTSSGWMIAKDETEPRDETIENVRAGGRGESYQTFILGKSTNTAVYNTPDLEAAIHARVRMRSHVYTHVRRIISTPISD